MKKLMFVVALVAMIGCSSKETEKTPEEDPDTASSPAAGKTEAKKVTPPPRSTEEICQKALACLDGMITADPERTKSYENVRKSIERADDKQKRKQCQQALAGAGYNPKAPASCK